MSDIKWSALENRSLVRFAIANLLATARWSVPSCRRSSFAAIASLLAIHRVHFLVAVSGSDSS